MTPTEMRRARQARWRQRLSVDRRAELLRQRRARYRLTGRAKLGHTGRTPHEYAAWNFVLMRQLARLPAARAWRLCGLSEGKEEA